MEFDWEKARSLVNRVKAVIFFISYDRKEKILKGKIKRFTGYKTVAKLPVDENQKFLLNFDVSEGEAQFILVQNGLVFPLDNVSSTGHVSAPISKGHARLRLVGEHTSLSFAIKKVEA